MIVENTLQLQEKAKQLKADLEAEARKKQLPATFAVVQYGEQIVVEKTKPGGEVVVYPVRPLSDYPDL